MKRFYVVSVLRKWSSLEVLGLPLNAHQTPGCVGFLPVFDSRKAAEDWCKEHEHEAQILEIQEGITAVRP